MHYLMFVTLDMPNDATSLDARKRVQDILLEDDSFCGEGGRFGSPVCDWFVIGGRWSGMLKETLLGDPYKAAFDREFPEMAGGWYTTDQVNRHRDALNELWRSFGGAGDSPVTRSTYASYGCEDDAMLVDQALFDHFLKPLAGKATCNEGEFHQRFADLDGEDVAESFIGRKWLVVVDYHF